jgi:ADP-glucose pyrophosphorylase
MRGGFLVIGSMILALLITNTLSSHNRSAYAHTFSQNEDTLYLTMIHQIQSQAHLVQSYFPTNVKLAQQHANLAMNLLNQNDPVVNNTTWGKEIAEKSKDCS